MSSASNPFWTFSLERYQRDGAPEQCLILQDSGGADVNVALFVLWLGAEGRLVDTKGLETIEAAVSAWTAEVVVPLRSVRRFLKGRDDPTDGQMERLRNQVKKVELESERVEQEILFSLARAGGSDTLATQAGATADAMERNLMAYVGRLPGAGKEDVMQAARTLARISA